MITVRLSLPWWALPYASACGLFARLHGVDPDVEKIGAFITRHIRVKVA